jgi:hypothetical protein
MFINLVYSSIAEVKTFMRSPGLLFLSWRIRFCSTVNPTLTGSCIMGIQKTNHYRYNQYQDSLCRIFMFLVQERLKIKILKDNYNSPRRQCTWIICKYINYIYLLVLYVNYIYCIYCCSDNDQSTCISHNQSIFNHNLNYRFKDSIRGYYT